MQITRNNYDSGSITYLDDEDWRICLYTGESNRITFYGNTLESIESARKFSQALNKAIELWERENE